MTVYVVQETKWVDPKDNKLKPKYNFEPARKYGEIEYLLNPSSSPFDLEPVLEKLRSKLENFCDDDYLLLVGSPVLLGLAVAVAADINNGYVAMLQWSGAKRDYIPVYAEEIFGSNEQQESENYDDPGI